MAVLEGYAQLLSKCGHTVRVVITNAADMKLQRRKAARHVTPLFQHKEGKEIPTHAVFNDELVDLSDIDDSSRY